VTNRNRGTRAPKRQNIWLPFHIEGVALASGGTVNLTTLLGRYLADVGREVPVGTTIGPVIGELMVKHTTSAATWQVFAAMYLKREEPVASTAALELEVIDALWYGVLMGKAESSQDGVGFFTLPQIYPIMTRAMRKVRAPGDTLVIQFDEVSANTALVIDIGMHIFMKLP